MKNLIKLISFLTLAGFMLVSCEGPMGMAGLNGLDGLDGVDANTSCIVCHNTANQDAKETQYESSDKGERNARSGKFCARCHSTEGFKEIVKMGTFNVSNELLNGTKIGCAACHKHASFEFSGDTVTQVLRTVAPVYLNWNNYNMTSFAYARTNATDYNNNNNLCANCHQVRGTRYAVYSDATPPIIPPATAPVPVTNVKFTEVPYFPIVNTSANENTLVKFKTGTNFSIHEGANQPDYLTGKNGYEYTGATYARTWQHSAATCTECHFNAYNATAETGGHTMRVNEEDPACTSCHTGGSTIAAKRTATLAAINAKLTELGDLLTARKVFKKSSSGSFSAQPSHDFYGTLLPTTSSPDKFALTVSAANTISTTTGLLVYNNTVAWATDGDFVNRIGREWKYGELGAAWNFMYVNTVATDENKAVHNPTYAMQLLQSSINWLNSNP